MAGMCVIRFPYFLQRWEKLAMHGGGYFEQTEIQPLVLPDDSVFSAGPVAGGCRFAAQ